ncbi:MAG: ribonuclease P protein component [Candidatus Thiodiazotropha taylori]|nr:ribonuclease P protein component [Candidatus Thiodiazotropha taylori]MCG7963661.1 ribonuclease P protein component [Candidatus Thiodiazotropha endolucinida]RLW54094.1 MAG: ribonuclease P protein component [gamma proteobacterium symbiont of Stewartia floridana]MCG7895867.1 ribonuclease P protein component [Candidatus Thiodiazotropha taylori]MCG7906553.1 ribonuclease P protein component [Candidatus Thiodiazotropha taylori]
MPISEEAFPRSRRLLKPDEFRRVFSEGRRSSDRFFLVLAYPNQSVDARLGLAVAKKHCRKAVDRNRIKRIIRESFRLNQTQLTGLDLVVVARQGAALADNRVCLNSLQQHWHRIAEQCAR